jgi:hypothetical protein
MKAKAGRPPAIRKRLLLVCSVLVSILGWSSDQPAVQVEPADSVGPRTLEKQTETAVIRDYLKAWQVLSGAFEQNKTDLLDSDFVGTAKEKLADTIREQAKLGIQTRYRDSAHHIQLVFYSPEGLSIQLIDRVEYDVQILDQEKHQITQHVRTRYVAVLTPTEVRWKVRILQAEPE